MLNFWISQFYSRDRPIVGIYSLQRNLTEIGCKHGWFNKKNTENSAKRRQSIHVIGCESLEANRKWMVYYHYHWLPVAARIQFKIAALTFDCVRGDGPDYFKQVVRPVSEVSCRSLRSASRGDLFVSRANTSIGQRIFLSRLLFSGTHFHPTYAHRTSVANSSDPSWKLICSDKPTTLHDSSENNLLLSEIFVTCKFVTSYLKGVQRIVTKCDDGGRGVIFPQNRVTSFMVWTTPFT